MPPADPHDTAAALDTLLDLLADKLASKIAARIVAPSADPGDPPEPPSLGPAAVAEFLGVSRTSASALMKSGAVKCVLVGRAGKRRHLRSWAGAVEQYLRSAPSKN